MLYGIAKCYVISIVAVSLCLFSSHCARCLILRYSVSNANLLIAFRVSPCTECQKLNYKLRCVLYQRSPTRVSLHFLHTLYYAKDKSNSICHGTYINIHTSIGNMTVCDSNGVPYHMAACNLEYSMIYLAIFNHTASNHQVAPARYSSLHYGLSS